ncbi:MAG: MBOAT family protein [Lachnospiraceae bacterium]|nr:MBOAT family protein [Lachnospiraceae bacterium]
MNFTGLLFLLVFLPIALVVYYIAFKRLKEYVLLALSVVFYTFGELKHIWLLLIMIVFTVLIGRMISHIDKQWLKRTLLISGVLANIGVLFAFKSMIAFSVSSAVTILPLGISFYTFKAVSYLADVYKGTVILKGTPVVHDALYLSFFAHIQSGPLTRYKDMVCKPEPKRFCDGVCRFLMGFSKKILLADILSHITTEVFATPLDGFAAGYAWLGSICYSLQLYYDFSGYSDMAIGISKMFGYDCMENFDHPYMTESISRFWRRWHISLSEWFRDYVYIPLGGSRVKPGSRVYLNLFIVWILTGIWHGMSLNFIAWGLGYFVMISFERITGLPDKLKSRPLKIAYRIFTLFFINCEWILFRASSLSYGAGFISHLFMRSTSPLVGRRTTVLMSEYAVFIVIALILCLPVEKLADRLTGKSRAAANAFGFVQAGILIAAFAVALSFVVSGSNNPFVYANF